MKPTNPSTPKVFISYRRSETAGHAGRLYDAMASRFGDDNVFMDVDLQPGVDFVERISTVLAACHVLLVVMGPDWARPAAGETHARIADPDDFVGLEVGTALRRSDVTVIPLLVAGGSMPDPDELPERLRALTRRNALELSDVRWRYDVGRLLDLLEQLLTQAKQPTHNEPPGEHAVAAVDSASDASPGWTAKPSDWIRRHSRTSIGAAGIAVVGLLAFLLVGGDKPSIGPNTATVSTSAAPNVGSDARPAGIPSKCEDRGSTQLAKDVEAKREWRCPISETQNVTGPSLTYLEYVDATHAHRSLIGSKDFELGHDWEPCKEAQLDRFNRAGALEMWCVQSIRNATVEISWRGAGSSVVGLLTCDPPTTVASAVKTWLSLV